MEQLDRSGDIGVDDPPDAVEILIQESATKTDPSVRQQSIDRATLRRGAEAIDPLRRREIRQHCIDLPAKTPQLGSCHFDRVLVGGDQEIEACLSQHRASSRPMPVDAPVTTAN
jgi:hypothetical protein